MTTFQLAALGVFVVLAVIAYGKELLAGVSQLYHAVRPETIPATASGPLGAQERVNDLLMVASLRDRLAAVNCATGVEACTLLLRAIVDHTSGKTDHTDCGK